MNAPIPAPAPTPVRAAPTPGRPTVAPPPANAAPVPRTASAATKPAAKAWNISTGPIAMPALIGIYGPGGVGKTELVVNSTKTGIRPLIVDLDRGSSRHAVDRIGEGVQTPTIETLDDLRDVLHSFDMLAPYDLIAIDSLTRAEELTLRWVIDNVTNDKDRSVTSIEKFGWGKGYTHIFEAFLNLLSDLDQLRMRGKTVVVTMHECVEKVPNPTGDDWIRFEPRLQNQRQGNIRARVKEWLDHLLFIGFDVAARDGKALGAPQGQSRTIHCIEEATHWAKTRSLTAPIYYAQGSAELWTALNIAKS